MITPLVDPVDDKVAVDVAVVVGVVCVVGVVEVVGVVDGEVVGVEHTQVRPNLPAPLTLHPAVSHTRGCTHDPSAVNACEFLQSVHSFSRVGMPHANEHAWQFDGHAQVAPVFVLRPKQDVLASVVVGVVDVVGVVVAEVDVVSVVVAEVDVVSVVVAVLVSVV